MIGEGECGEVGGMNIGRRRGAVVSMVVPARIELFIYLSTVI
jgi:hypothetical protein